MSELPESWTIIDLGSICENVKQVDPKKMYDDSFKYVDISSIDSSQLRIVDAKEVPISEAPSRARQLILKDDIVFSTVRTNLRRIARVGDDLNNQIASTGFAVIRPKANVNAAFIFYYVSSDEFVNEVTLLQRGASYPAVRSSDVFSRRIPLAPLPEQKRIVAKLDTLFAHLDQLKARLQNIPTLLKQFRQAVLTQAVTGKLTEEWSQINIGSLGKWNGGGTPSKSISKYWNNGTVPWITPKDMKDFYLNDSQDKISNEATEVATLKLIEVNSILIVMRSGILRRILPVAMNIVPTTINQDLKALTLHKNYYPKFIFYSLLALEEDIRNQCMKSGTTVESIEFPLLKNFNLRIPKTIEEQKEIVRRVESLFTMADRIEASYTKLQEKIDHLPQAILSKAFRGELVGEDDIMAIAAEANVQYNKAKEFVK